MKKGLFILFILLATTSVSFAQGGKLFVNIEVIVGNRQPSPSEATLMQREEAKHPNIAKAMNDIGDALKHLHESPDQFGGRKAQAEADLRQAWVSLRKALYFAIYKDR